MPVTQPSFVVLSSVDSTNNYAMAKVHAGLAKHGDAYFSAHQTNGKGQRGRHWQSMEGQNIALSVIIEPKLWNSTQQFELSAIIALACCDFFTQYAGNETTIKWPNDIYWRDRKAGGILIENLFAGKDWKWAVVGMGININQTVFDPAIQNPVALKQITGKSFDSTELGGQLHLMVMKRLAEASTVPFEKILDTYNQHLYKQDALIKLKKGDLVFDTLLRGVSAQGQLLTIDSVDRQFDFGEVEWVLGE